MCELIKWRSAAFLAVVTGVPCLPAVGEAADGAPDVIVTAPTRTPVDAARTGASITVLTQEDLERDPAPTLAEALERVPGISIANRGGPGTSADVSIRGFGADEVLLRVDGIELADPGELRTQADFGQILTGDIASIEVLRGAQSALYGGEASGGVVEIKTGRPRGSGFGTRAFLEGGSFGTFRGGASVGGGFETWDLSATVQGLQTDGISAASSGVEDDGYRNLTVSAVGSVDMSSVFTIGGAFRAFERETEIDRVPIGSPPLDQFGDKASSDVIAGRLFARHAAFDGRLVNEFSVQALRSKRAFDQATDSRFEGDRLKAEWLGTLRANDQVDVIAGLDWTREGVETGDGLEADSEIAGGFLQTVFFPTDRLTLTAALRHDAHTEFGGFTTWRATAAWTPIDGSTLRGSAGTGFRAPSNRELFTPDGVFGPVGNSDLTPEETVFFEIGVDQRLFDGHAVASATYFDARTDDLIAFDFGIGYVQQPGESRRRGVEFDVQVFANDWLDLEASYTFMDADDENGDRLQFVPRDDARLAAVARPLDKVTLAASASYIRGVVDSGVELSPYLLVNASAAYAATDAVEAYLRVENLLDQDYERVDGFSTPGIAAFVGLRARF